MDARYAIERKIASGGMATVYLGRGLAGSAALGVERPVAIKVCHPHLLESASREHRTQALLDEARIAARIHHPNVVAVLDVVVQDDSVMIVMEYVEGLTVAGVLRGAARADARVPVEVALRIVGDALAGLHAAHELRDDDGRELGVVHRDVSPQNILVGIDGFAKLADFGVFKGAHRLAPSTESGELKGKLGYVAPEVYRGEPVTRRADVYALGVVLWEMLAGKRLFHEDTHAGLMHRVLSGRVPPLASLRSDIPAELDAVLARALASDPGERFSTAEEIGHALEALPIAAASTRAVAKHVRGLMSAEPPREEPRSLSPLPSLRAVAAPSALESMAPSIAPLSIDSSRDAAGASDEVLTPSEYVTPVRAVRPARHRSKVVLGLGGAVLVACVLAGSALVRAPAASRVAPETPRAPSVLTARAASFLANDRARATSPTSAATTERPAAPSVKARRAPAGPSAPPAPAPAPAPAAQPFYDPKEL